jgi:hypothetical protein
MKMDSDFTFIVGDDPDYEDLIAEIYYKGGFLCLISQEEGFETLDIAIHPRKNGEPWRFKLSEFEDAIARARQRLFELRKGT